MQWFIPDATAADATSTAGAPATSATGEPVPYELSAEKMMMDNLLVLGLLFFVFYFILIRPQQKKLKTHQAMLKALAKGDKVITNGGIIGTVVKFEGNDIVLVEISPNVKVRFARHAISEVTTNTPGLGETANDN